MLKEKDYKEFVSLVKRMREAQEELEDYDYGDGLIDLSRKVINLESEVGEYLKKMEEGL